MDYLWPTNGFLQESSKAKCYEEGKLMGNTMEERIMMKNLPFPSLLPLPQNTHIKWTSQLLSWVTVSFVKRHGGISISWYFIVNKIHQALSRNAYSLAPQLFGGCSGPRLWLSWCAVTSLMGPAPNVMWFHHISLWDHLDLYLCPKKSS